MKKRYMLAGLSGIVAGAVATKLMTRPVDVSWPDSLDFIYNAEYSWFTRVNGARIHYQEAGDESATPIILIHGFISSNLIWSHVLVPLARKGFRVFAPDLPGYGYSDKPADAQYTIAEQAHAVIGLMRTVAKEAASRRIRVNVVAPGPIANDFQRNVETGLTRAIGRDAGKFLDGLIPLGRHGLPEEIGQLVLYLASDQSSFSTGGVFMADGGMSI